MNVFLAALKLDAGMVARSARVADSVPLFPPLPRKFAFAERFSARKMSAPSGDPDEKLRYGLRMIENAYEEKTRALDQEVHPRLPEAHPCLHSAAITAFSVVCQLQNLRSFSQERQAQITALERRVSELEMHLRDSEQKVQQHQIEKNHMAQEMKAMQRDMSKLDQVELPLCRTG